MKLNNLLQSITSNISNTNHIVKQITETNNNLKYKTISDYNNYGEFEVISLYLENDDIIILI